MHRKVRTRPRARPAPPPESRCQQRGCRYPWTVECWLYDLARDADLLDGKYCSTHAHENGFCPSCGNFWAGVESFDFSPCGLCENCCSERAVRDESHDDDEGYALYMVEMARNC